MAIAFVWNTKKNARKNNEFAFYPQYFFLGVHNSSTFNTFWVLDIDVPPTDLLLRKYTQHHLTTHKTFTPYDMYDVYDFEKTVTLRTVA